MRIAINLIIILAASLSFVISAAHADEPPPPGPMNPELERIQHETDRFEESRSWGVWDWYWHHDAELVLAPQIRGERNDWFTDVFAFKFVPLWNQVMKDMAAKVIVFVAVLGAIFGSSAYMAISLLKGDDSKKSFKDKEALEARITELSNQITLAGFLSSPQSSKSTEDALPDWLKEARSHPDSALAELRRQIEKEIKRIAAKYDEKAEKKTLFDLIELLKAKDELTILECNTLQEIRKFLNTASHASTVDPKVGEFILLIAPGLLQSLKSK